jgi:transposase
MSQSYSDAEVKRLVEAIPPLLARISVLEKRVAELEAENARLKKNSSNSSKPPSSDIIKPPHGDRGGKKRRIGGQSGHAKHQRPEFPPEQIDKTMEYELAAPGKLVPLNQWRKLQQMELVEKPFVITEHRARLYRNPATGTIYASPFPPEVAAAGLCGPRLSAFIGYLKGGCRMSYTLIQDMLRDVMGLNLSTGQLAKIVQKNSAALEPAYQQLLTALPKQAVLGVDETGHPERGKNLWNWSFRAPNFAAFYIAPSRSSQVLLDLLGADYAGTVICDFYSAYRKFLDLAPCALQFCQAHLIRDIAFLLTLPHRPSQLWAGKLLALFRKLFRIHHQRLANPDKSRAKSLDKIRRTILALVARAPTRSEAQNIRKRFRKYKREYFTFIESPHIAPTNNFTERTLRFVVIDRKLTQGTRGTAGKNWCQRVWSVLATCRIQGRSAFQFIAQSIACAFKRMPTPQLLPAGP